MPDLYAITDITQENVKKITFEML